MLRTPQLASTTPAAARVPQTPAKLALEDVRRRLNVTSRPVPVPITPPLTVNVTSAAKTTTTAPSSTPGSTVAPPLPTTTTTSTTIPPVSLSKPHDDLATQKPAQNVSAGLDTPDTPLTKKKTSSTTTSTTRPTTSTTTTTTTTTTTRHTTTTTKESTTTTKTSSTTTVKHAPPPIILAASTTRTPPVPRKVNDTFTLPDNSSVANKTRTNTTLVVIPGPTTDSWPLSKLLVSAAVPLLLGLVILVVTMVIIACCRRRQADSRGSRIKYKRADMIRDDTKCKTKEPELPMLYALVSIGQRKPRSWSDSEETLPLTQLKPQHNGTWRTEDELTTPPCATERMKNATDSGSANAFMPTFTGGDLDATGGDTIPETIMVENDLYETQDVDGSDIEHVPGATSGTDSDSSSDCADAARHGAPVVRDDISSLSADGQLSASDDDQRPSLMPLDMEVTWRPFHDYDVVYTPRSDAGAMVRRVDRSGYVKSKLQRNHAYEEVRVDRAADGSAVVMGAMPPCMSASPALPPRRTPAASPALPPRMMPETSSRRPPSASPALPPRWLPRAPAADEDDLTSPPLPPRGSSRTPAAERGTPEPPRRSTSVPSSPVAPHPSPPPIPLPPTPPVTRSRTTSGRSEPRTPTEPLVTDSDDSSRSDEEHDYDAVTSSPAEVHDDLADHRYSVVDDDVNHRYSAGSSASGSSNRDNVYEQISFEPS